MDWKSILERCRNIKEKFNQSYKCINVDRPIKEETLHKHLGILLNHLEEIRILLNVNYSRLTTNHKIAAEAFFNDIRYRLVNIAIKKGFDLKIPTTLHETINFEQFPSLQEKDTKMAQTVVEFLNTASKLITEFDGKAENLGSFVDSLKLVDLIKGSHEAVAISLIKTKLKGNARNLINNENTITEIVTKLQKTVKGESVEVITAKIMNIKQNTKTANTYCNEIETLTKSLENAYITDGLSSELATKYATNVAVKALTKNCTIDKVKLIMEAGQFNSFNDAISKFINSCTEATGQQNTVLQYRQNTNNYRRGNNKFLLRGNYPRNNYQRNNNPRNSNYNNFNTSNNNFNSNNRNTNLNQNQQRHNNRRNHVHATESNDRDSENSNHPLGLNQ